MDPTPASAENREIKQSMATQVLYPRGKNVDHRYKRPWVRNMLLTALSAETIDHKGRKTKKMRLLIDRLLNMALAGEQWAIQEILNRVDGKPTQMLGSDPNAPLPGTQVNQIQVVFVDADGNISRTPPDNAQDTTTQKAGTDASSV